MRNPVSTTTPVKATKTPRINPHFARFNGLVDSGLLGEIPPTALLVLLVYFRHMGNDGIAYPGASTIAKKIGHKNTRRVYESRDWLVQRGYLQLVRKGGTFGNVYKPNVYRVCTLAPLSDLDRGEAIPPLSKLGGSPLSKLGTCPPVETGQGEGLKEGLIEGGQGTREEPLEQETADW